MNLTGINDAIRVQCSGAMSLGVYCSWEDGDSVSGKPTAPGRNIAIVNTTDATVVVPPPANNNYRTVTSMIFRAPTGGPGGTVLIQATDDGVDYPGIFSADLAPGDSIVWVERRGFQVFLASGIPALADPFA